MPGSESLRSNTDRSLCARVPAPNFQRSTPIFERSTQQRQDTVRVHGALQLADRRPVQAGVPHSSADSATGKRPVQVIDSIQYLRGLRMVHLDVPRLSSIPTNALHQNPKY